MKRIILCFIGIVLLLSLVAIYFHVNLVPAFILYVIFLESNMLLDRLVKVKEGLQEIRLFSIWFIIRSYESIAYISLLIMLVYYSIHNTWYVPIVLFVFGALNRGFFQYLLRFINYRILLLQAIVLVFAVFISMTLTLYFMP